MVDVEYMGNVHHVAFCKGVEPWKVNKLLKVGNIYIYIYIWLQSSREDLKELNIVSRFRPYLS